MLETQVLLRTMLYQTKIAKSVGDVEDALLAMCSGDDVAAVEKRVAEHNRRLEGEKEKE